MTQSRGAAGAGDWACARPHAGNSDVADAAGGHNLRGRVRSLWNSLIGALGLVMGLLPHVGLPAGTALAAGFGRDPFLRRPGTPGVDPGAGEAEPPVPDVSGSRHSPRCSRCRRL